MFDDILRELKRLERGVTITVPVNADEEGYIEKECPSDHCKFVFRVLEDDWKERFSDEEVFCPLCRHSAPADQWWTSEQIDHAQQEAVGQFEGLVGEALHRGTKGLNRRQPKRGFIQMSMEYRGTRGVRHIVPVPAGEPWGLQIVCESCGANFSVLGSAFFCPCCGYNSVERTFDDAIRKVRLKSDSAEELKRRFSDEDRPDDGELLARSLLETSLSDCVIAFQRLAEQLYARLPGVSPAPRNVFQRIEDGSTLWEQATGQGYNDFLSSADITN